jgi:hypothetical protein
MSENSRYLTDIIFIYSCQSVAFKGKKKNLKKDKHCFYNKKVVLTKMSLFINLCNTRGRRL